MKKYIILFLLMATSVVVQSCRINVAGKTLIAHYQSHRYSKTYVRPEKKAQRGDAEAQYRMGNLRNNQRDYSVGGVQAAIDWYDKAAAQGHAGAMNRLGQIYKQGYRRNNITHVAQDPERAAYWFLLSAQHGDMGAAYEMSRCYTDGVGVERDATQALYWRRRAAELGHGTAQYQMGYNYDFGVGVEVDIAQAYYWYGLASKSVKADPNAQYRLAALYEHGHEGVVEQNIDTAFYWYRQMMFNDTYMFTVNGMLRNLAQNSVERIMYKHGDPLPSAEQGDPQAQFLTGIQKLLGIEEFSAEGRRTVIDMRAAIEWFEKAAQQGHAEAQYLLALCYDMKAGGGLRLGMSNPAGAQKWYIKAAEQGKLDAYERYELAQRYDPRRHVAINDAFEKDGNMALFWYDATLKGRYAETLSDFDKYNTKRRIRELRQERYSLAKARRKINSIILK